MTESSLAATFTFPAISYILIRNSGGMTLTGEIPVVGKNPVLVPLDPLQTQENCRFFV